MKCQRCGVDKPETAFKRGRKTCNHCYKFNQIRPPRSAEWRANHSKTLKGRKIPPEIMEKTHSKIRGRKYTLEHRLAISRGHQKAVAEGRCYFKKKEVPSLENQRERLAYRIWREKVKERDGFKCTNCGVTKNLCVHHIESYYRCAKKRLDVDNGLTLCMSCHAKLHNPKGVKKGGGLSHKIIGDQNQPAK